MKSTFPIWTDAPGAGPSGGPIRGAGGGPRVRAGGGPTPGSGAAAADPGLFAAVHKEY